MNKLRSSIGDIGKYAASRPGMPAGWDAYSWTVADGGYIVVGCVPDGIYSSGKKKGRPRYSRPIPNTKRTVVVSNVEMEAFAHQHEATTGECWCCKGEKQVWSDWSAEAGNRYAPCKRCNATGVAPSLTEVAHD